MHIISSIMGTEFRTILNGPYSGHENRGNLYSQCGTTTSMKIEVVCTISLERFSRQLIDRNFHCKISEFSQFAEHCGRDKFIFVFVVL